jgi:hypothetical protein
MRSNWTRTFRRLAAGCAIGGATMFASAMSYAATIAFDTATDAAYDDGWQAGDNGGFGFGPWDFSGTYNTPVQQTMDIFSHPNDLGRAWTLFNPNAPPDDPGTDIARAGRAIPGGLAVGSTIHVVVDNPTERRFFRGYTVQFNNGGASACYAGDNCTTAAFDPGSITPRMRVGTFEYFTNGKWFATGTGGNPTLFDLDTHNGMRIDLTLDTIDTFTLKMTPLNNPAIAYTKSGTLTGASGSAIDWVEINLYNTDSDYYPGPKITGGETDFYTSNMWITQIPEPSTVALCVLGGVFLAAGGARKRSD